MQMSYFIFFGQTNFKLGKEVSLKMRRRIRNEEFLYGKTKRDTEFGRDLLTPDTKETLKKANPDTARFANNPRPRYEIYPGE